MAFCSSCGAQLEGDGRFCVKCGADQTAKAAAAPAVAAAPPAAVPPHPVQPAVAMPPQYPPPAAFPPQPAQPVAGMPPQYPLPPGQIPIVMGAPPVAPAKSKNWLLVVVVVCGILYGLYYIGTHDQQNQNPGPAPAPQTQPGGGGNQALVQQQQFSGRYDGVNGQIQISQGQWTNGSNVSLQTATLGCAQYDQNGQSLTQNQTTLNGPAQAGQTVSFQPFQIGAMAQGVQKVNCAIVAVTPAQ